MNGRNIKSTLQDVHTDLAQLGKINSARLTGKPRIVYLWKRYKRVAAIAAVIAGFTTLTISAMVYVLSPKVDNEKIQELSRIIQVIDRQQQAIDHQQNVLGTEVKDLKNKMVVPNIPFKAAGSGFLIDGKRISDDKCAYRTEFKERGGDQQQE